MSIIVVGKTFNFLNRWLNYKIDSMKLHQYEININTKISNDVDERLNAIITSCFEDYSILNLVYKSDWYIKEEEEVKINKDIVHLVAERISPIFMQQLMTYYNEDAIMDIIAKRVYFKVTEFVMHHNSGTGI